MGELVTRRAQAALAAFRSLRERSPHLSAVRRAQLVAPEIELVQDDTVHR